MLLINKKQSSFIIFTTNVIKQKAMSLELDLQNRSGNKCELCQSKNNLSSLLVEPTTHGGLDENVYVCDASIIPKIGNANLSLTIGGFAIRLAQHLIKKNNGKPDYKDFC